MGGAGSGGHKKSPGDTETHSAWLLTAPSSNPNSTTATTTTKLPQATCKYCSKEMAQHTSRQRSHLLVCATYLAAMRDTGVENTITRQAADPAVYARMRSEGQQQQQQRKSDAGGRVKAKEGSARKGAKRVRKSGAEKMQTQTQTQGQGGVEVVGQELTLADFSFAIKVQALALVEAGVPEEEVRRSTGMDVGLLGLLRGRARERGFDPQKSMVLRDEYVLEERGAVGYVQAEAEWARAGLVVGD